MIEYQAGLKSGKVTIRRESKEAAEKSFDKLSKNAYEPFGVKKTITKIYPKA